ncbi:MAG: RecX family transcriptional regulator [Candidatus Dojkabacteria bacterium]|nr:RecX family transcriptional regulator [Candidatus Dojkabacteria bacterium]
MIVTALEQQKKDNSRLNVYMDGNFFCGLSVNIIAQYNIYQGKEIEDNKLEEILFAELQSRFFDRAVSYLVRSPKTEYQIKRYINELFFKKKGKWFEDISKEQMEQIQNNVLDKLHKYDYIDDKRYAELFVTSRLKNKPRGRAVLYGELLSKGVSKDIVKETLDNMFKDEYQVLKDAYKKKYKEEKISFEDTKKISFLQRKGFNWDLIERYINDESTKEN